MLYSVPTKFHCCQTPNGRVKLGEGGGLSCPLSIIGVSRTLSKKGQVRGLEVKHSFRVHILYNLYTFLRQLLFLPDFLDLPAVF